MYFIQSKFLFLLPISLMLRNYTYLLSCLLFFLYTLPTFAQFGNSQVLIGNIPDERYEASVDLNQDGFQDIIVFKPTENLSTGGHYVKYNDGTSQFMGEQLIKNDKVEWAQIIPADLNGDGRLDLVVYQKENGKLVWLRNEGVGQEFSWRFNIITNISEFFDQNKNSFLFEDLDGDNDLDFLCDCSNSWYKNNGQGEFLESFVISDELGQIIHTADVNQNGTNGVLAYDPDAHTIIEYEYQTDDTWVEDTIGTLSFNRSRYFDSHRRLQLSDIDNDGDLDVIYYGIELFSQGFILIFEKQEEDYILKSQYSIDGDAMDFNVIDYDNNGYADIVAGVKYTSPLESYDYSGNDKVLWLKNQDGNFSAETILDQQYALDIGKYNQDELVDIVSWKPQGVNLLIQEGAGFDTQSLIEWTSADILGEISTVELNGDDRPDFLFFSNNYSNIRRPELVYSGYSAITVLLSQSSGYEIQVLNSITSLLPESLRFADVDNDDDQDVVALVYRVYGELYYEWEVIWYENESAGIFGERQLIGSGTSEDFDDKTFEIFDSNGDGYPEVAAFNGVYKNNQDSFEEINSTPKIITTADLSGDNAVDIISENMWYENDGSGNFTARTEVSGFPIDFDGDGDIDVIENYSRFGSATNWYENDGSGNFTLKSLTQIANVREYVDVDADNDADAVTTGNGSLSWVENTNSKGTFGDPRKIVDGNIYNFRFSDTDKDGDQDLFVDLNGLVKYENLSINEADTKLSLELIETDGLQQDTISIPVKVESGFTDITTLSLSLTWDTDVATYAGVESTETLTLETGSTSDGQVGITWKSNGGANKSEGSIFLSLLLVLKGEENSIAEVSFADQPVAQTATSADGKPVSLATKNTQFEIKESKAPTNITLDNNIVDENQEPGAVVGKFKTEDADNNEGFEYALVNGDGDDDNGFFDISKNSLITNATLDYEADSIYNIRVRTTDPRDKQLEKKFEVKVGDVDDTNNAPTNIALSVTSLDENNKAGAVVGKLNATDADSEDTHTFSLVDGKDGDDNSSFAIGSNQELIALEPFDYEEKDKYNIRIQADDGNGGKFSKAFIITINDVDESTNSTPTAIALDNREVEENLSAHAIIGTFTTTDADTDDEHIYSLVEGAGDAGNALFQIKGDQLETVRSLDYEEQQEYSIRVQTDDNKGGKFATNFTIEVIDQPDDPNESPTNITLDNNLINENQPSGTLVGKLRTEDFDNEQFSYSLADGSGSTHNRLFTISNDELYSAVSFDYEIQSQFSIRIQTDDGQGGTFSKAFAILISDVEDQPNRPPTNIVLNRSTIEEGQPVGTQIGILSAIDPDNTDQHQYRLLNSNDEAAFSINGNELLSAVVFDYNSQASYLIQLQSDDGRGGTYVKTFAISVTPTSNVTPLGVNNPIEDQQIVTNEEFNLVIPDNVFQGDSLTLTVTQSDDSPLPDWLTFDSTTNTLNGTPSADDEAITIKVTATNPQGNTVSDEFVLALEGITSLEDEISKQWKIYPVPTRNYLLIESQTGTVPLQSYRLMNAQGKVVRAQHFDRKLAANVKIEVAALVEGIYLLEIQTNRELYQRRILIQ